MSDCFRFFHRDYLDSEIVASRYVSSANASYPVSNIYDKYRRTKVWRSAGYWDLTSGDTTIVFRETIGVDLTATITADEYTSTASFLTAIKTALDAAGASTYTVTQDTTTSKIKITSDGLGGGGIFQLMWTDANSADMAAILGFDTSANDTGALTYTADELKIHTSEWLKWDFGIPTNPDGFIITSGDRNSSLKISPNAVIKLQGNSTDNWSAPEYEATLTFNNYLIVKQATDIDDGLHTGPLRYWRFYIEDKSNPNNYVEFGLVFLGAAYATTRGCPNFPFTSQYTDRSNVAFSEAGQTFVRRNNKSQIFTLRWNGLTKQEIESIDDIYNEVGNHEPFWVSYDTAQAFSTNSVLWVKNCRFNDEPSFELVRPNNFSMNMVLREEL